ncbi:MAG: hypothetical protein LBD99_00150 [Candidatus Margulisbacteria bacterium]|jgi:hypothetical protein|nr:hypothetical protein [Candidatus Margulisiibacteriota bacterium]
MKKFGKGFLLFWIVAAELVFAAETPFTIKALYVPDSVFSVHDEKSKVYKLDEDYDFSRGFGLAAEYALGEHRGGGLKTSLGVEHIFSRDAFHLTAKGKVLGAKIDNEGNRAKGAFALARTAVYFKPRVLFGDPERRSFIFYLATKLSYNILNGEIRPSEDARENLKLKDGFGFGLSLGFINQDALDVELGIHYITSAVSASKLSSITIPEVAFAIGYRI